MQILGLMEQFGIKPDIVTYSHQLNTFSSLGHMAKCMKVFDKMIEAANGQIVAPGSSIVHFLRAKDFTILRRCHSGGLPCVSVHRK